MTVRGLLRWMLPWYASGAEFIYPHVPDNVPERRRMNVSSVPNSFVIAESTSSLSVQNTTHKLSVEE